MKTTRTQDLIVAALACLFVFATALAQAADALPSWNDGKAKQSVIDFVKRVTTKGGKDFVPPAAWEWGALGVAALVGILSIARNTVAADFPAGLSSPDHGVVCNSRSGACFDRFGPSIGLTEAFLGPDAARALTAALRKIGPDHSPGAQFSPSDNILCRRETGPCRIGEVVHEALTAVLYGPHPARSRSAEAAAVVGVKWKWLATRYNNDTEARRNIERDGLWSMGDMGYLDAEGYLYVCDRASDMVISGGVNIYPAEIESVLALMPGVRDCAVFGIPDEEFGEALCAAVQPDPGARLDAEQVKGFLRNKISSYKVPRRVDFHPELPREESGKIFKRRLRAPYWEKSGRRI